MAICSGVTPGRCLLLTLSCVALFTINHIAEEKVNHGQILSRSPIPIEDISVNAVVKIYEKKKPFTELNGTLTIIPRRIFMFWDKGWDEAPTLQKLSLDSFRRENPEFEVTAMDLPQAEELIERSVYYPDDVWTKATIQAKSDIIRVELLAKYGGIWADATVYCNEPLLNWLNDKVIPSNFLSYDRTGHKHRNGPWISTWFLVSTVDSLIIQTWRNEVRSAWKKTPLPNEQYGYFWVHTLFSLLVHHDAKFGEELRLMPLLHADGPHCIDTTVTPFVYKLTAGHCRWKCKELVDGYK